MMAMDVMRPAACTPRCLRNRHTALRAQCTWVLPARPAAAVALQHGQPPSSSRPFNSQAAIQQRALPARPCQSSSRTSIVCQAAPPDPSYGNYSRLGDAARKALTRATKAMSNYGWTGFWVQLTLSSVSAIILLFSVAFTSQSGPKASLYFTLVGVLAGLLSTFWNFSFTRVALKMQAYLEAPAGVEVQKIKKQQVLDTVTKGMFINLVGLGSTLVGVQTLVGLLVAKTLSNSSMSPFVASSQGYSPVLALDVFLVQAATNTLLGHFLSLCCALWLLHVVGEGKGVKFSAAT